MLSFSPYRGKKHRHGKGIRSRNCRLNVEIVCSVGFAVAFGYKKMLVCCSAGVRVTIVNAVICLVAAKSTAATRVYSFGV